jgi:hypothetical protein
MRSLARHGSGTAVNPLRAEYVQQRSNLRQIECCLGCDTVVGTPRNVTVFRASDATKPFVTPNAELLDRLASQFEEQLRQYEEEDRFLGARAPYEPTQTYRPSPLNRRNFEGTPYGYSQLTTEASGFGIKLSARHGSAPQASIVVQRIEFPEFQLRVPCSFQGA